MLFYKFFVEKIESIDIINIIIPISLNDWFIQEWWS